MLVNLTQLDPPRNGGTARVAQAVCRGLLATDWPVVFVVNGRFAPQFWHWAGGPRPGAHLLPHHDAIPAHTYARLKPNLIISPLFGIPYFDDPAFADATHITAIPDALSLDMPALFNAEQRNARQHLYETAKRAETIIMPTAYARERLLHHLDLAPEQVTYVYHGADKTPTDANANILLPMPYVFYPANTWPHKRHDLLFRVMAAVWQQRPELKLVLTGGRKLGMGGATIPDDPRIRDLGYVSEADLDALYRHAEAMVFTSAHEGFGMPILEAMQRGCPVICAPVAAIPEVAGDTALYVDSDDPAAWAEALLERLPPQRDELIRRGRVQAAAFTWEQAEQSWLAVIQSARSDQPAYDLDLIRQIEGENRAIIAAQVPSIDDLPESPLKTQLEAIEAIRRAEQNSRLAQVPVIGLAWRLMLRLLNLGRMWRANASLQTALIHRIHTLEAEIEALKSREREE